MNFEIIIPTYNNFELVQKNLPQVLDVVKDMASCMVTVVDDGSKTEEQEMLLGFIEKLERNTRTKIHLLLFKENLGFPSNVNRAALISTADFIVLLNSDAVPEDGFLRNVEEMFKNEKLFGIGMMDKSIEEKNTVLRGRGITYWKQGMFLHKRGEIGNRHTSWISGGSSILRTSLFKKLGGFNPLFNPFYWEDIDLSYIARKSGLEILFSEEQVVVHKHYEGSIKKHYNEKKINTVSYRNQLIFIWKNITDVSLLVSHVFFLPIHILNAILRWDTPFLKGILLAVILLPDIMRSRAKIKKSFVLSDKSIIP